MGLKFHSRRMVRGPRSRVQGHLREVLFYDILELSSSDLGSLPVVRRPEQTQAIVLHLRRNSRIVWCCLIFCNLFNLLPSIQKISKQFIWL